MKKLVLVFVALAAWSTSAVAQINAFPTGPGPLPGVQGPASATSGHLATFNGTTGKIIQDGGVVPTSSPCSAFGTTTGTCLQGAGALGTPSSGNASNLTNIPVNQATSQLPVANGGSGGTLGGNKPYFRVTRITSNFTVGTQTVVQFNNTEVDTASGWDGTNFRYVPNVAGRWEFSTCLNFGGTNTTGSTINQAFMFQNGTRITEADSYPVTGAANNSVCYKYDVTMNGSTDYIDIRATNNATSPVVNFGTATDVVTWFAGHWLGPT